MSNSNSTATANVRMGWFGFLGVVFVLLKLNPGGYVDSDVENWPWWLVTMPFWLGIAVILLFIILGLLGVGVAAGLDSIDSRKHRRARAKRLKADRKKRENKGITNF